MSGRLSLPRQVYYEGAHFKITVATCRGTKNHVVGCSWVITSEFHWKEFVRFKDSSPPKPLQNTPSYEIANKSMNCSSDCSWKSGSWNSCHPWFPTVPNGWYRHEIHPRKLTWNGKNTLLEKEKHGPKSPSFRFQPLVFGGCNCITAWRHGSPSWKHWKDKQNSSSLVGIFLEKKNTGRNQCWWFKNPKGTTWHVLKPCKYWDMY